jgi:peptidoglycan/LPS O-acetylase OafA/YrhL
MHARLFAFDGLRGLAALSVVLYHFTVAYEEKYGHSDPMVVSIDYGYFGLQMFFVISGFVILMSALKSRTVTDFAVSRLTRLMPAYLFCLAAIFIVVKLSGRLPDREVTPMEAILNAPMIQPLIGVPYVDGAHWTLTLEALFYVVIATCLLTGWLRRIDVVCAGLLVIAGARLLLLQMEGSLPPGALALSYYGSLYSWAPFFVSGIVIHLSWRDGPSLKRHALLLFGGLITFAQGGIPLLIVFLLFTALAYGAANRDVPLLATKPLVFLGTISYSLYLVHQNVGYVIIRSLEMNGVNANLAILISLISVIACAVAINRAIEVPVTRFLRLKYKTRTVTTQVPAAAHQR